MERITLTPRHDWKRTVVDLGFSFHTINGDPYWDETACYAFTANEIDTIEEITADLESMCLEVVDRVVSQGLYDQLRIPEMARPLIEASWKGGHKNLYGRFDLAYNGVEGSPIKVLEYNADTPTSLLEASVVQWQWLSQVMPDGDQFNSIHEKLIAAWQAFDLDSENVHFSCIASHEEDHITVDYLRDTALQAGFKPQFLDIQEIGWDGDRFVDLDNREIHTLFKLYPWEWLLSEAFGAHIIKSTTLFIEPPWKMILSNKGLMALLWEFFPDHPNLLPASFNEHEIRGKKVCKPLLSREGANVSIVSSGRISTSTAGPYGSEGYVYQSYYPIPDFEGNYPIIGSWVIASESAGIGIREDKSPITGNDSRFIPHYFI